MTNEICEKVREELPALHYGDLDAAIRASVEGHLAGCSPCRAALEAVRETAAGLDRIPLPVPSEADWSRLDARIEVRVAPLRAARMARSYARLPTLVRVAAAVLVGGLSVLSAGLLVKTREQSSEIAVLNKQVGDLAWAAGDTERAASHYIGLAVTASELSDDPTVRARLLVTREVEPEVAGLYAQMRHGGSEAEVRERIGHFLASFPRHRLADQVFLAQERKGAPKPPPIERAFTQPVPLFPAQPLERETTEAMWRRAVRHQRDVAAAAGDPRVSAFALFRAGNLAEEALQDRALALELYRDAARALPSGAIADAADERTAALVGK